jgi:hypothetical protein
MVMQILICKQAQLLQVVARQTQIGRQALRITAMDGIGAG